MEFLGTVEGVTDNGKIVVIGSPEIPDIGNPVFDSKNNRIGTVKRIFGPTSEPYISVTVDDPACLEKIVGKELYTTRRSHNGKDKRRNRRD